MPLYLFNIENEASDIDSDGIKLRDGETARIEAVKFVGECLQSNPALVMNGRRFCVEVCTQSGARLLRIAVTMAEG